MSKKLSFFLVILFSLHCLFSGCMWIQDVQYTPQEAETKLIAFSQKEGNLTITTRREKNTQWVYVPLEIPLFEIKAIRGEKAERKRAPLHLLSIEGQHQQGTFSFEYDIIPDVLPAEKPSYGSGYNEVYTQKRQLIYQGIQETFFNVPEKDQPPSFFVVVIADITKGVATKSTFFLRDLRQFMTGVLPPDEYYMREQNEVIGNPDLIGDKKGHYLTYTPIVWHQFLVDQIKTRIRFKFVGSNFPPKKEEEKELLSLIANTFRFYEFDDFSTLHLSDYRNKKEITLSKEELKAFEEKTRWEESQGKVTVIHFNPNQGIVIGADPQQQNEPKPDEP